MRPPTWPAPEPPESDEPSWAPITAPQSVMPPSPPPLPPPPPTPVTPPSGGGGGRRAGAAVVASMVLVLAGFVFARVTDDNRSPVGHATPAIGNTSSGTVDPNASEPVAAVAA